MHALPAGRTSRDKDYKASDDMLHIQEQGLGIRSGHWPVTRALRSTMPIYSIQPLKGQDSLEELPSQHLVLKGTDMKQLDDVRQLLVKASPACYDSAAATVCCRI